MTGYQRRKLGVIRRKASRTRGQRAYELRAKSRMPWKWIAEKLSYRDESSARRAAKRHQEREGLPDMPHWYLTLGEMAYTDRSQGATWAEIAEDLEIEPLLASGHSAESRIRMYARRYARRAKRPWPAIEQCPGQDHVGEFRRTCVS